MARLLTAGAETLNAIGDDKSMEGSITTAGAVTVDTGTVRSGTKSFKFDTAAGNVEASIAKAFTGVDGQSAYVRGYFRFPSLITPASRSALIKIYNTAAESELIAAALKTDGTIQLHLGGGAVGTAFTPSANVWHRLEVLFTLSVAGADTVEFRVDGVTYHSGTSLITAVTTLAVKLGWTGSLFPGANSVVYVDDIALNDSTGSNENTWPNEGRQVLLLPTADNAVGTGWTLGTGTATGGNAFGSVDNIPPVGVADLAVGSDPKQIRNASSNANTAYDATMTTYAAAGITPGANINVLDPIVWTAAPVSTSAKAGTVGLVSNPAITPIALGAAGTPGAFWQGNAGAGYPTGWKLSHGTLTYLPAVATTTAPVMRINQVTSSTRIAVVCFMGIYVDFTNIPPSIVTPRFGPS